MYTGYRKYLKHPSGISKRGQFWVRNLTKTHVTLYDLSDTIPPLQTVDLLARNPNNTMELIHNSMVLKDLLAKNILVKVKGPKQITADKHIISSKEIVERPKRSSVTVEALPFEKDLLAINKEGSNPFQNIDDYSAAVGIVPAVISAEDSKIIKPSIKSSVNITVDIPIQSPQQVTNIFEAPKQAPPISIAPKKISGRNKEMRHKDRYCQGVSANGKCCERYSNKGSTMCHFHKNQVVQKDI